MGRPLTRHVHFVGFRDERYWSAWKVWRPDYYHQGWDLRALREIDEGDVIIFAEGEHDQLPRVKSFNDIEETPSDASLARKEVDRNRRTQAYR